MKTEEDYIRPGVFVKRFYLLGSYVLTFILCCLCWKNLCNMVQVKTKIVILLKTSVLIVQVVDRII